MWYQRDSNRPKDLKRPRTEMHQMDEDQFGPSVSKRPKTVQVPTMQTTHSSLWQNYSWEGKRPFLYSDLDNSSMATVTSPTTSLLLSGQSAGQQSSERIFQAHPQPASHAGYQCVNSLLGTLHQSRRRQKASEAGVHQHSAQHGESSSGKAKSEGLQKPERRPTRPQSSQKKVISLRIDSKLY